jgi:hypothetical protein
MRNHNAALSIDMIRRVAQCFGPDLLERFAFLGGASLPLYLTDLAVSEVRPTRDVDVIIEVASYGEYTDFAEQLRKRKFQKDMSPDAPICRWKVDDLIVDVMPTNEQILGFTNRWYSSALQTAQDCRLSDDNNETIRLVTPVYFLATKLEAFAGRGENDVYVSHDLEDIVTLVDGRPELLAEIQTDAAEDVRAFIAAFFQQLLSRSDFEDAVEGHLPSDARGRLEIVLSRMKQMAWYCLADLMYPQEPMALTPTLKIRQN